MTGDAALPDVGRWRPLGPAESVPDGESRGFDPLGEGRDSMFVVRRGDQFFAYRNACPHHAFARMAWKKDTFLTPDGVWIRCAAHGALFRIEDGFCTFGPCIGAALVPVVLRIEAGHLFVPKDYAPGERARAGAPKGVPFAP